LQYRTNSPKKKAHTEARWRFYMGFFLGFTIIREDYSALAAGAAAV
jgi:hypothetical protein